MKKEWVNVGIIGLGNMGRGHVKYYTEGRIRQGKLIAVCDTRQEQLAWVKENYREQFHYFNSSEEMLGAAAEIGLDAVIIDTPHYSHPPLIEDVLKADLHVLAEKPIGVYTKAVRRVNNIAEAMPDKKFATMFLFRLFPAYMKLKDLLQSGELGQIRRINWIITHWYRPQSYYDSGGWRATWAGEGGGVLANQCPHELDLWQWLFGLPARVRSFCGYGRMHDIEVEDDVTAYMEYENGATGVLITSTGDAPGTNRLEVSGDYGKIVIEDGDFIFWRNRISEREFNNTFRGGMGNPEVWKCEVPIEKVSKEYEHNARCLVFENWVQAILVNEKLVAPGIEGINSLLLSNSIHLSSWTDEWVSIPFDEELYYRLLQEKIDGSSYKKNVHAMTFDAP